MRKIRLEKYELNFNLDLIMCDSSMIIKVFNLKFDFKFGETLKKGFCLTFCVPISVVIVTLNEKDGEFLFYFTS